MYNKLIYPSTFQRQTNGGKNAGYETVSSYQYKKSTESELCYVFIEAIYIL